MKTNLKNIIHCLHWIPVLAAAALLAALSAPVCAAPPTKEVPFKDARLRIEINATDGDSGLHLNLDADGWKFVNILDPNGKVIFHVEGQDNVRKTGLTELFFESAEPGFEELPLKEFLQRFPAGEYKFVGETIQGEPMLSTAILTHALPDGPELVSPAKDSVQDPEDTEIKWKPVADPKGSKIVRYEVLVTQEEPLPPRVLSAVLPATATSMEVPPTFLLPGTEYKYEVLAIEEGGNQTLSETEFRTAK